MPRVKTAFAWHGLEVSGAGTEATEKSGACWVSRVLGHWSAGDVSSKVVPTYTVEDATGKTSPPRHVGGGGGEIWKEQLVPHPWLPPHHDRDLQPIVLLRLPCFSKLVWKPMGCDTQPVIGTRMKRDG